MIEDSEQVSQEPEDSKKYREIESIEWFSKDKAIRMLCVDPSDYAERQRISKAVDYAFKARKIEVLPLGVDGKGKRRRSLDMIRPEQFFKWATEKWPEIEDEDRIGPVWRTVYSYLDCTSALHARPLEIPADYDGLKEKYLTERERLVKRLRELQAENVRLKEQLATETMVADKWRVSSERKSKALTGKKYNM